MLSRPIRANNRERSRRLPGDELVGDPIFSTTHAITIRRSPCDVWPWLAQMGAGRGGWYSYDFIDNGCHPSAQRINPDLQQIAVGTVFPALPGATEAFVVALCDPPRALVLTAPFPDGRCMTSWSFVLEKLPAGSTRLLVRGRASAGYRLLSIPTWLVILLGPVGHFVMQRKQLLGIASRVERN